MAPPGSKAGVQAFWYEEREHTDGKRPNALAARTARRQIGRPPALAQKEETQKESARERWPLLKKVTYALRDTLWRV